MKILSKILRRITAFLLISLIFFFPVSLQTCQENQEMQDSCCCCGDLDEHNKFNATKENDCGCQLNEKKQNESQPVLFTAQQNNKLENSLCISEVNFNSEDYSQEFRGTPQPHFSQVSKGPPLYILNSSFII